MSLNNLAILLYYEGSVAQAIPLMERAIAIYADRLGEAHPDTQRSLRSLVVLRKAAGQKRGGIRGLLGRLFGR